MSYKTILVHCDASRSVGGRLAVAAEVAQRFEARLVGLHAREPFEVVSFVDGGMALAPLMEAYEAGRERPRRPPMPPTTRRSRARNFASEWRVTEAFSDDALAVNARYADLLVVGQADPEDAAGSRNDLPEAMAFATGRPVLVVPQIGALSPVGKTVMLCWNASRESARAAADALPFLRAAEKVIVLVVDPEVSADGHGQEPGADVAAVARAPRREGHRAARRGGRCQGRRDDPVARRRLRRRPDRDGHLRSFAPSRVRAGRGEPHPAGEHDRSRPDVALGRPMDPALLAAYDRPVPRYTSYPTAAQFTPSVGPVQHDAWLRDLNEVSASLYVHVPFCRELCWYCACHTMAMNRPGTLDSYADALLDELEALARVAPGLILEGVQWGGGTPSQLGAARLQAVGKRIAALFDRRCDAEVSLEIDPRHWDREMAAAAGGHRRDARQPRRTGFRRGCAGRDQPPPKLLGHGGQPSTGCGLWESVASTSIWSMVCRARRSETLAATLDLALKLGPDRFAVFGYAHVPWMKPHQKLIDEATLPDDALRAAMSALVAERLVAAGYRRIGLDHYARPGDRLARAAADGTLHRNFQGYVADRAAFVAGIGASAISSLPRGFTQNVADPSRYMAAVTAGGFATARGIALTRDDRLRGAIIERVMCHNAVDLEAAVPRTPCRP